MPQDARSYLESILQGLNESQFKNLYTDPLFLKFWQEIGKGPKGKEAQQELIIKAKVTGVKDVEGLVEAMNAAVGASEKYFKALEKYRSTVTSMNLAWKEGAAHMKKYLEDAQKAGGQTAVLSAAVSYLGNSIKDGMDNIEDAVKSFHRFRVEEETFARTTRYSVDDLESLRTALSLTKSDMEDFYTVLKKSSALGLDTSKIKDVYKQLRAVYGQGATEKMASFTEMLPITSEMRMKFMADPSSELDAESIQRIVGTGKVSKLIELRAAGLFGGKAEPSASAGFENSMQKVKFVQEKIKDEFLKHVPHQTVLLAGISGILIASGVKLANIAGFASGIRTLVQIIARKQGYTGGMGGGFAGGKAMRALGAGASIYGGYLAVNAARTGVESAVGMNTENAFSKYAGPAIDIGTDLALIASLGRKKWAKGAKAVKKAWPYVKTLGKGLLHAGSFAKNAAGVAVGGFSGAALTGLELGNYAMANTWGRYHLGYAPGLGEQASAVWKYGLSYRAPKGGETTQAMGLKDVSDMQERIKAHEDALNEAGGDLQEEWRKFGEMSSEIEGAVGNLKGFTSAMDLVRDSITKRERQESSFYSREIGALKANLLMIEKTKKDYKTDTQYIALQKQLEEMEGKRAEAKVKALQDFRSYLAKYAELAEWGGKGKRPMLDLQRGVIQSQAAIEAARMRGGEFAAAMAGKSSAVEFARGRVSNVDAALLKVRGDIETARKAKDESKVIMLIEEENKWMEEKTRRIKELNDAMLDTSAFDILQDSLKRANETLLSSINYIKEIDGSYEALVPLWRQEIDNKKKDLDITMAALAEMRKAEGFSEDAKAYKDMVQEMHQKEIDIARSSLEYAKSVRDAKMEEVNIAHDWLNEQADFMEDMGGYFGDILTKRSQSVQKERENIAYLEDYLKMANLSGVERQKGEIDLEKAKMKVTRDTIGIQKSAYEKFVGMAFGALGDIGFKKGRMEDVLTLGKTATEVKNRAGLYIGAGMGMTRNELSALNATGVTATGGAAPVAGRGFTVGEALARRATSAAVKPEMKVGGKIELSLSEDLRAKVKEWAIEIANDPQFGSNFIRANGVVTVNNRASASPNR